MYRDLFYKDPSYKGSHTPPCYGDLFYRGSSMGIHSIWNLISAWSYSARIYSMEAPFYKDLFVDLVSKGCHKPLFGKKPFYKALFSGDLFYGDLSQKDHLFYRALFNRNIFYKIFHKPLFYRDLFYRGSILFGPIL